MDTPSVGVEHKRDEEFNKIENGRTAEKELLLHKIIIKKEDQTMGLDSEITITILTTELIRIADRIIRTVDDCLTDDQINSPTETMEIDRIMGISITKVELGELMEFSFVHDQDKDRSFLKVTLSAISNIFILGSRHLEDQTVTRPLVPFLTNKISAKQQSNINEHGSLHHH